MMVSKILLTSRNYLFVWFILLLCVYILLSAIGPFDTSWRKTAGSLKKQFCKMYVPLEEENRNYGIVNNSNAGQFNLHAIETLFQQLNDKLNQIQRFNDRNSHLNDHIYQLNDRIHQLNNRNSQLNDQKYKLNDDETKIKRNDVERIFKVNYIPPLDFSKIAAKMPRNLTELLERPANRPHRRSRVPLNKMPYIMDPHYKPSRCPKTVGSMARYSVWFKERFKPGLKMFLDEEDVYNFSNYYKLAHYGMPFGYAKVDRHILGSILNNPNFTNAPLTDVTGQCVRCAVVGSGGILKGSNAGKEIDSHDFVFRVNQALTKTKYASDVGRKTSFYEFFPESLINFLRVQNWEDPDAALLFTPFKKVDLHYVERMLRRDISSENFTVDGKVKKFFKPRLLDPSRVKITHPDFYRHVHSNFFDSKGLRPTTGALVVFTAIYLCDEVTIYGFGYDPRFTMHYYDSKFIKITDTSTGSHDIDNERGIWNKLHSEGIIKWFKRDL